MRFIPGLLITALIALAQTAPNDLFSKTDVMIPMRDGVRLHTEIYSPKHAAEKLPFLITRTPYGQVLDAKGFNGMLSSVYTDMVQEGYIFGQQPFWLVPALIQISGSSGGKVA